MPERGNPRAVKAALRRCAALTEAAPAEGFTSLAAKRKILLALRAPDGGNSRLREICSLTELGPGVISWEAAPRLGKMPVGRTVRVGAQLQSLCVWE